MTTKWWPLAADLDDHVFTVVTPTRIADDMSNRGAAGFHRDDHGHIRGLRSRRERGRQCLSRARGVELLHLPGDRCLSHGYQPSSSRVSQAWRRRVRQARRTAWRDTSPVVLLPDCELSSNAN